MKLEGTAAERIEEAGRAAGFRKLLTIIESNFNVGILHDLKPCSLCKQRHFRCLGTNVAHKHCSVTVLSPVSPW